ncbi:MAG: hypothetical protein LBD12_02185 [Clostridiales Family XIII bacterium]|jgi:tight adherence protein B|nr:hypothetical protein [Clostridiales Family XIII bacterium]
MIKKKKLANTLSSAGTPEPLTDYRDYSLNGRELRRWYAMGCPAMAALGFLFYHSPIMAAVFALLPIPSRRFYAAHLGAKRREQLAMQFKDMLASLSASFMTGRLMTEALTEAEENLGLAYGAHEPIMTELRLINQRLGAGRESEKTVLFDFADRSADQDIAGFMDVYFTCLQTGADQIRAVSRASELILEKLQARHEMRTLTAQKRLEGKLLAVMPPLILAFLSVASPDYIAPLYGNAAGALVMSLSLLTMGIAFYWSTKIMDVRL